MLDRMSAEMEFWINDGEEIKILTEDRLYLNAAIMQYLNSNAITNLIASKGMGKTHLMRFKRALSKKQESITIPVQDSLDRPRSIEGEIHHIKRLDSNQKWQELWELSIGFSVLFSLCTKISFDDYIIESLKKVLKLPYVQNELRELIENVISGDLYSLAINPSDILNLLIKLDPDDLSDFRTQRYALVLKPLKNIPNHVSVFIDGVDHAIAHTIPGDKETWKRAQLGLLKASYNFSVNSRTIKVYISIRQEAWAAFQDEDKVVIQGRSFIIKYGYKDLKRMTSKLCKAYEGHTLKDFIPIERIINSHCGEEEEPFDYILRHSLRTPRSIISIMQVVSQIIKDCDEEDEVQDISKDIEEEVDRISAEIIDAKLTSEMASFLPCLSSEENVRDLISRLHSNLFTTDEAEIIRDAFENDIYGVREDNLHPFCELYNIGLLGVLVQYGLGQSQIQKFKNPDEFDWKMNDVLPEDTNFIFLHPGLQSLACKKRRQMFLSDILIGHDKIWDEKSDEKAHKNYSRIFISYAEKDDQENNQINRFCLRLKQCAIQKKELIHIWFDKWKLHGGEWVHKEIENAISESDILLLFLSQNSINSEWVKTEWQTAFKREIENKCTIIPVLLDDVDKSIIPDELDGKCAKTIRVDIKGGFTETAEHICNSVKKLRTKDKKSFISHN